MTRSIPTTPDVSNLLTNATIGRSPAKSGDFRAQTLDFAGHARRVADLRSVPGERVDDLVPGGDAGTPPAATPPALADVCDLLSER